MSVLTDSQIAVLIKDCITRLKAIEVRLYWKAMANGKYNEALLQDARLRLKRNYKNVTHGDSKHIGEFTFAPDVMPTSSELSDAQIEASMLVVLANLRSVRDSLRLNSHDSDAYTFEQVKKVGEMLSTRRTLDNPLAILDENTVNFDLRRNNDFTGGFQSGFHVIIAPHNVT